MAKSGSFSSYILSGHYTLRVDWSAAQSVANNTSTITAKVYLVNDWDLSIKARSNNTITINGVTANFTSPAINTTGTHLLTTYTTQPIAHNNDGTKSVSMSCSFRFNATINDTYYGTMTASTTATLDTIARASKPSCITWPEHTQDVGYFGDTISIHMNRKSDSFTHTVRFAFGTESDVIDRNVTTGTTWDIPKSLMNLIPGTTKGSGTIYVDTYNGSTFVGTDSCGFTAYVPTTADCYPTIACTLEDITGVDDYYGSPVQGLSQIKATVTPTLAYNSPIKSYSIEMDGMKYTTQTATSGVLKNDGDSPVKVTVVDERGRPKEWPYTMKVKTYARPSIGMLSVHRCDANGTTNDQGDHVQVTFSATVTNLVNAKDSTKKNTASYALRYKKSAEEDWTEKTITPSNPYEVNNYSYIFEADESSSYDVELSVTDRHATTTRATSASTAFSLIDFHSSGTGIRFGGVAEDENTFRNDLHLQQTGNRYSFSSPGTDGSEGFVCLARINVLDVDADTPITFILSRRQEESTMTVHVRLSNPNAGISNVGSIRYEGANYLAYLAPGPDAMTWDFYVHKGSADDVITLQDWYTSKAMESKVEVTFPGGLVSTVPTPYHRATPIVPQSIIDAFMPVGYVLTLYNHNDPNTMYPGTTWLRIENRFLWATTPGGNIGGEGGESTHTLTIDEMPSHNHDINTNVHWDATDGSYANFRTGSNKNDYGKNNLNTAAVGGGKAHNNMPPYVQVSIWHRTA